MVKLSGSTVLRIPCESSQRWYLTEHNDSEESTHGTIVVAVVSPLSGVTGSVGVALTLDWTMEFEGTDISSTSQMAAVIRPDIGYQDIFTDSDGSYDATHLTFKMHAGGSMVPFTSAQPGHIYTVEGKTEVPYYDAAGAKQKCSWFSRMHDAPGLLCFSSKEDALSYVRTGDINKALPYNKAGEYTKPSVPTFKEVSVQKVLEELEERNVLLRAEVRTLVQSTDLERLMRQILLDQTQRPRGTATDPVKVFVEDPVRGALEEAMGSLGD